MNSSVNRSPYIALIDDDAHSSYLFSRMFKAVGGSDVQHFSGEEGFADLVAVLSDPFAEWPDIVVVDLKAHSRANLDFLAAQQALFRQKGIAIAVMVPTTEAALLSRYYEAGAAAIFFRQSDLEAYRRELTSISIFQARNPCLDAVGM